MIPAGAAAVGLFAASSANAVVSNPGDFNIWLSNGTLAIDGASLDVSFSGLSATVSGTVDPNGWSRSRR
jgi:hypothetical protein